jgi:hypothetical protein
VSPGALQELRFRVAEEHARAVIAGDDSLARETAELLLGIWGRLTGEPAKPPRRARTVGRCSECGIGVERRTPGCQTCGGRDRMRRKRARQTQTA